MINPLEALPPLPADCLKYWQDSLQWQPNAAQMEKFELLYHVICVGNQHLNLTRLLAPEEFWEKHLWDSVAGLRPLHRWGFDAQGLTVIDIGTGGGFPGLPVAILYPEHQVTLLDSTQKKIQFLNDAVATLELQNVQGVAGRAEAIAHAPSHRAQYDIALIRAVASPPACAEYALPYLKIGGIAVLYQGHWTEEDGDRLQSAVKQLEGKILAVESFVTPISQSIRHCIYLQKTASTPHRYPRDVGVPAKNPLS